MRLRREKKVSTGEVETPTNGSGIATEAPESAVIVGDTAVVPQDTTVSPPPPVAPSGVPSSSGPGDERLSSSPSGAGGLFSRMYGDVGARSTDERDRQAAHDFQQVLAPAMDLLQASVPEATSPEEAARILSESQGELVADPDGGSYVQGDAYGTDARIYYRLLRRDFEKNPRPSSVARRQLSPHLHQAHRKGTGNKGW